MENHHGQWVNPRKKMWLANIVGVIQKYQRIIHRNVGSTLIIHWLAKIPNPWVILDAFCMFSRPGSTYPHHWPTSSSLGQLTDPITPHNIPLYGIPHSMALMGFNGGSLRKPKRKGWWTIGKPQEKGDLMVIWYLHGRKQHTEVSRIL